MNKIMLMGRFVAAPEMLGKKDHQVARWRFAVDRRYKQEDGPEADFFNCVAFGKTADFVGVYMDKGSKVAIVGRLENNNFEDEETGDTVYRDQIVVEEIYFAEPKKDEDGKGKSNKKDRPKSKGKR